MDGIEIYYDVSLTEKQRSVVSLALDVYADHCFESAGRYDARGKTDLAEWSRTDGGTARELSAQIKTIKGRVVYDGDS